jgi:hypothetical protein
MTSMLIFAIAFAVGCLSGVVFALWSPRRRSGKPDRMASLWRMRDSDSTTVQRVVRR